jgi:RNA polymerase sigma-70 factor (ECF subfamily)
MLDVRAGDKAAFSTLIDRYEGRVRLLLNRWTRGRIPADDLAQEVFLRVFRARSTYEPNAKFSTWLSTIVKNVALNAGRSNRRAAELTRRVSAVMRVRNGEAETMPSHGIERAELRSVVRLAMNQLSDRQQTAIALYWGQGMSYAGIADTMSVSPQAVKSLLHRARVRLRDSLSPYMEHGRLDSLGSPHQLEELAAAN